MAYIFIGMCELVFSFFLQGFIYYLCSVVQPIYINICNDIMCMMASIKKIVYILGESRVSLSAREIASKMSPINLDKEARTVGFYMYHYKQFFKSEVISPNPNVGKKYSLSKNGLKFYEKLLLTYDPITDTQIIPQDLNIDYAKVK